MLLQKRLDSQSIYWITTDKYNLGSEVNGYYSKL
uniref:Uncharacterized protein n=1 Tax=Tetranychus urticae TaxID=32264 RepID=T1KFG0_TETUR